jgi:hypothetical protein
MDYESFALLHKSLPKHEEQTKVVEKSQLEDVSTGSTGGIMGNQLMAILKKNSSLEYRKRRLNIGTCCCIFLLNSLLAFLAIMLLSSGLRIAMEGCPKLFRASDYNSLTCGMSLLVNYQILPSS